MIKHYTGLLLVGLLSWTDAGWTQEGGKDANKRAALDSQAGVDPEQAPANEMLVPHGKKAGRDSPPLDAEHIWVKFKGDWLGFGNWALFLSIGTSMLMAVALAALIAYHPRSYGKAATLEEVEQPKIFLMYALVGAVVAQTVKAFPDMALVVFAIGGLFRFRTDTGQARDTGRVILVTCVGLCCGLGIYPVGAVAVAFAWILIYLLEARVTHKVLVKGIEPPILAQTADAYREVLVENGFVIISEKKNVVKKQASFVFRAPGEFDRDELEGLFKDIPPKLQGAVDWESS